MNAIAPEYDVLILGGGVASLCLSRLLSLEAPQLSLLSVDTGPGPSRRIGESTVEIGAHFLHSRLQLAELLARTQLPKNGLRYWFDDAEHTLSFDQASEDGPATFSYWRSYQLERETFERALVELNEQAGQAHLYSVGELEVLPSAGEGVAVHRLSFVRDGVRSEVRGRWIVDATAVRVLQGPEGRLRPDERLSHSACWTWFEGARRMDDLVPQRASRPCFGPRLLSTNHFLGEGYWIWAIPLASGLLSVGLVYDHSVVQDAPQDQAALLEFLRSHRMLSELLEDATPRGFGRAPNYSRRPQAVIRPDRRAWVGMSAGFADPFYSNGLDIMAMQCESLAVVIQRDLAGEGLDLEQIEAYNRSVELFYEQVVVFVSGLYPTFASHELSLIRYRRDIHVYWTLYTWAYLSGRLLDVEFLREFFPRVEDSLERGRFFSRVLKHTYQVLKDRGDLRRSNQGRYSFNQLGFRNFPYVRCEQQLGTAPDLEACVRSLGEIDTGCFLALLDCLYDGDRSPVRGLLFEALEGRYEQVVALEQEHGGLTEGFWGGVFRLLSEGVCAVLAGQGIDCAGFEVTAESYGRVLPGLLAVCTGEQAEAQIRSLYYAVPELLEFADAGGAGREQTQPPLDWSVEHTPWLDEAPSFATVYDLLGDSWLRGKGGSLASAFAGKGGRPG